MKVSSSKVEEEFSPVTLTLTLTSAQEVRDLCNMFGMQLSVPKIVYSGHADTERLSELMKSIFNEIRRYWKDQ